MIIHQILYFLNRINICRYKGFDIRLAFCDIDLKSIPKSIILSHPYAITIRYGTKIGENCTIRQCVTIGEYNGEKSNTIIGDNVSIGCNSIILGNIKIGNNVIISAGSIVLKDIPDNKKVIGLWK